MPHGEGPLWLGLGEFEAINSVSLRNHYYGRNVDTIVDAARLEVSSIKTSFTRSLMTSFTREEVFFFSSKKVFP
jgi:hypothetical protein